jgi:hypothetical protein
MQTLNLVSGLYFVVNGKAEAHWYEEKTRTVGSGDNRREETYTIDYSGEEVYLNTRSYLIGYEGKPGGYMPAGVHTFPFETTLPQKIPASFEGLHGNIRYNIEVFLDIPSRADLGHKVPITVVQNDDLNEFPELKLPCKQEELKKFCCLFCESEPLLLTVTIPCGGFTPGSTIPISIEYLNKSNVQIDETRINLKRIVTFIW